MSEQTTVDWRTLDAGDALDRVIAERRGWRIERSAWAKRHLRVNNEEILVTTRQWIAMCGDEWITEDSEAELWKRIVKPHWSTDANAALTLPWDDVACELTWAENKRFPDTNKYRFGVIIPCPVQRLAAYADTPALAVCRAWLAYQERMHA